MLSSLLYLEFLLNKWSKCTKGCINPLVKKLLLSYFVSTILSQFNKCLRKIFSSHPYWLMLWINFFSKIMYFEIQTTGHGHRKTTEITWQLLYIDMNTWSGIIMVVNYTSCFFKPLIDSYESCFTDEKCEVQMVKYVCDIKEVVSGILVFIHQQWRMTNVLNDCQGTFN